MIREILRQAWRENPRAVLLAVPATAAAVLYAWVVLVVAIVAGTPA